MLLQGRELLEVDSRHVEWPDASISTKSPGLEQQSLRGIQRLPCGVGHQRLQLFGVRVPHTQSRVRGVNAQHLAQLRKGSLDEIDLQVAVLARVDQKTQGRLAVAACASGLLVVGFNASWISNVDYLADIRKVHAHAKGARGNNNAKLLCSETLLDSAPAGVGETAVIWRRRKAPTADGGCCVLGPFN